MMIEFSKILHEEKWRAVVTCDKSYDNVFLYGVTTTRIYCRPSCKSKTPVRTNVVFFEDAINAIEAGFRPCKRCCPDKIVEPDLELLKKAIEFCSRNFTQAIDLNHISKQLGISPNVLIRLFKGHSGITPAQYLIKLRVSKAVELLGQKDISILDIADMAGFRSISNFYRCFRKLVGLTPKQLRERI